MKKLYSKPQIEVAEAQQTEIIATSLNVVNDTTEEMLSKESENWDMWGDESN